MSINGAMARDKALLYSLGFGSCNGGSFRFRHVVEWRKKELFCYKNREEDREQDKTQICFVFVLKIKCYSTLHPPYVSPP